MQGLRLRSVLTVLVMVVIILLGLGSTIFWSRMSYDPGRLHGQISPALASVSSIHSYVMDLDALLKSRSVAREEVRRAWLRSLIEEKLLLLQRSARNLNDLGQGDRFFGEALSAFENAVRNAAWQTGASPGGDAGKGVSVAAVNVLTHIQEIRADLLRAEVLREHGITYGGVHLLWLSLCGVLCGVLLYRLALMAVYRIAGFWDELSGIEASPGTMRRYSCLVILASFLGSLVLVTFFLDHPGRLPLLGWWAVTLGILVMRVTDYLRKTRQTGMQHTEGAIRVFGAGCIASALVWAFFPAILFAHATTTQRLLAAFVYVALAGAGTTVLAPLWRVMQIYLGLLLLPLAACFVYVGSDEGWCMAGLCVGVFALLLHAGSNARQAIRSILVLSEENRLLADESVSRQLELENLNTTLEDRVHERTVLLELEVKTKEKYAKQLELLAQQDPLTGLLNRRALAERMDELLARAAGVGMGVQVLFIDLDRFKEVNDVQGHYVGDQILIEVARRLCGVLPEPSLVARWGGDEFVAVVPAAEGSNLVSSVRRCVADPISVRGNEIRVDASIGISLSPEQGSDVELLVRQADVALHHAKLRGRSCASIYDEAMGDQLRRLHDLGQALREALERQALDVVYQPIVPQKDGQIRKMEALVRWHDPVRGTIPPGEFIGLAEEAGLIGQLGSWVMRRACSEVSRWDEDVMISVNVSALQVMSGMLVEEVRTVLQETGLSPSRLELELTESVFVRDVKSAIDVLVALRNMGVQIAIDDFGTGYSSLSYLNRLPVNTIKIDRSFVVSSTKDGSQLLRAILGMAKGLRCSVVAEGAETLEQLNMLCDLGVDYIQGNKLCPPVSARAAQEWLARRAA